MVAVPINYPSALNIWKSRFQKRPSHEGKWNGPVSLHNSCQRNHWIPMHSSRR